MIGGQKTKGRQGSQWQPRRAWEWEEETLDLTALMDVIFILLIFFILTAGIQQMSTTLNLPRSEDRPPGQSENVSNIGGRLEITHGPLSWKLEGETIADFAQLRQKLEVWTKEPRNAEKPLLIAPQRDLPVEEFVRLLNLISTMNHGNIQILSEWSR